MSEKALIQHRLSLVIRLLDSITGNEIQERDVMFYLPEGKERPVFKGDGVYLFLNMEQEDFGLEVHVYGYEPEKAQIHFKDLQQQMPIREIYLLPLDYPAGGKPVLTLRGKLPGIKAIEAVSPNEVICSVKEYQERKRIMTLMNPHNVRLSKIHYGILSMDRTSYEKMEIEDDISTSLIKLKDGLSGKCELNQPISSVIHGQVSEDGTYLLKVSESREPVYLVRYVVDEEVCFRKMDFHHPEELMKGGETWES